MKSRLRLISSAGFLLCVLVGSSVVAGTALADAASNGLVSIKSPYPVAQTIERFQQTARDKGLKIFDTVDHAQGADSAGLDLRPTTVVIFGNPKAGTPFMQCAQTIGIDLPMKMLVWQDAENQTWIAYNDPAWIAKRHGALKCPAIAPITKALSTLAARTVAK